MIVKAKQVRDDGSVVEIVIWSVPDALPPCEHAFKYRLYFGRDGECRVRYDNERGKGDHRHWNNEESAYRFTTLQALLADFERDVTDWSE